MRTLILFLISYQILLAQSGTEILKKIQNKFNSINDFTANFVQTNCNSTSKTLNGKILYKKKNKFIVELKNQTVISNGEIVWNYNHKQKQVIISYFSDEPSTYSIEKFIYNYPELCNIKLYKNIDNDEAVELIPKEGMLDIKSLKIWKDKDYLIRKLEIVDLDNQCFVIEFNNYQLNQNIPDSKFTFNPPKGIRIIDLR
ncbi:MAG: outer membrane lipoprotein chaperone LolA [Melioribacter sp.]|nr:outer membrane lipoprotein chaperone LolA [Melioribacter sp.]